MGLTVDTSARESMKKYIVLSVNDNPDYLYYVPLVQSAWMNFGWTPLVIYNSDKYGEMPETAKLAFGRYGPQYYHEILVNGGYRSDTVTQVSRLYACKAPGPTYFTSDAYLMTGDIDMLPLSDYWHPNENAITCYGHDLTGFGHYPICYIGMKSRTWHDVMQPSGFTMGNVIENGMIGLPQAKSKDFYKYWFSDQDLITKILATYKNQIDSIRRGQYSNGFAWGRVDRGSWHFNHSQFIDCHMFQQLYHKGNQDKFDKTMELLTSIWPDEDFQWFIDYTNEFRRLTGHA